MQIGTTFTIKGFNFGNTQDAGVINFGTTTANITSWSDTSIVATVPQLAPQTYGVSVTTKGQSSDSIPFLVTESPSGGDFSIEVKPSLQSVIRGSAALYNVFVKPINGFNEPVTLVTEGLTQDVTAEFQKNPVFPGEWVELKVTTNQKTPLKYHSFVVKGSTDILTHQANAKLLVKPAKPAIELKRTYSKDLTVLLIPKYRKQSGDKIETSINLINTTGTWIKATMKLQDGDNPVNIDNEDYAVLIGPYGTKSLGNITFNEGQSLHYVGDRVRFEPMTILGIDLLLRGTLGQEVPPTAFFDLFSHYEYANTLLGDILQALLAQEPGCKDLIYSMSQDLKDGDAKGFLTDLANYLHCMGAIKKEMRKLFVEILKDKKEATKMANLLDKNTKKIFKILDVISVYEHLRMFADLMCPSLVPPIDTWLNSLGVCTTLGAPIEGWVRLEAEFQDNQESNKINSRINKWLKK